MTELRRTRGDGNEGEMGLFDVFHSVGFSREPSEERDWSSMGVAQV